ncbi:S8 family serine peptidase [Sorangium sp. So ce260]|uniref:S8 family serine peptidase n=1 Tax=Sorangium sp. So ce260 TaxID=3133291 RepID=UPI003F5ECFEA
MARLGTVLAVQATADQLRSLSMDPHVLAIEASRPGGAFDVANAPTGQGSPVARPQTNEGGDQCLVAIIDSGIDVLHETFRDANGQSRIVAVWDQTDVTGPSPHGHDPAMYPMLTRGTLHTASDIAAYLASSAVQKQLGRDQARRHGTHVASIAAGRGVGPLPDGMAPDAPIVVVIPTIEAEPGQPASIGYSASHAQALQFIDAWARKLRLPVVVNVSSGMNAGAHDGTSLLETAFDEFTTGGRAPGRVIVKSAGNEQTRSGHAVVAAVQGVEVRVDWDSAPRSRREDYLEAWFDAGLDLEFTLRAPNNDSSSPVHYASPTWRGKLDGTDCWLALRRFHVDNGDACLQIGLSHPQGHIRDGIWVLAIFGKLIAGEPTVDVWAERVRDVNVTFQTGAAQKGTLSIPGTARSIVTVGAYDAGNQNSALFGASSNGPTRDQRCKPDLVAPGVNVLAAASGTAQGAMVQSGTSMAAPFVSGAIALILSRAQKQALIGGALPNAQQIRSILSRTCRNYTGRWHGGYGYGCVDVNAALAAF